MKTNIEVIILDNKTRYQPQRANLHDGTLQNLTFKPTKTYYQAELVIQRFLHGHRLGLHLLKAAHWSKLEGMWYIGGNPHENPTDTERE